MLFVGNKTVPGLDSFFLTAVAPGVNRYPLFMCTVTLLQ